MAGKLNKHESKYFNTARLMNQALIQLIGKKEYSFITVKDLCNKAGVNRSTFYLHYETMDDLLGETLAYTSKQFKEKFYGQGSNGEINNLNPLDDMLLISPKYLYPYLNYLRENQKLYLAAMENIDIFKADEYTDNALKEIIFPILEKYKVDESEKKYMLAYYISGTHAVVSEWVKNGCKEDNEFIYKLLLKLIFNGKIESEK